MTVPGAKPKFGTIKLGHADVHQGFGLKDAMMDDYKVRFGLVKRPQPASSSTPPDLSAAPKRRRYFGEGK